MASKREMERRRAKRASARKWAQQLDAEYRRERYGDDQPAGDPALEEPAKPSKYGIKKLQDLLKVQPIEEVYAYTRVSDRHQDLTIQRRGTIRFIENLGVHVRRCFGEVSKGKSLDHKSRPELHRSIRCARTRGIPLVVPCISRIQRTKRYYHFTDHESQLTVGEFEKIMELTEGVQLATLFSPDAKPSNDEDFLRAMACIIQRRKPGRKRKESVRRAVKQSYKPDALRLRGKGLSFRRIAEKIWAMKDDDGQQVSIAPKTIREWCRQAGIP